MQKKQNPKWNNMKKQMNANNITQYDLRWHCLLFLCLTNHAYQVDPSQHRGTQKCPDQFVHRLGRGRHQTISNGPNGYLNNYIYLYIYNIYYMHNDILIHAMQYVFFPWWVLVSNIWDGFLTQNKGTIPHDPLQDDKQPAGAVTPSTAALYAKEVSRKLLTAVGAAPHGLCNL